MAHDVEAEHARLAGVGFEHGAQDPHRRGFAGPVRPEQTQYAASLDRKIDVVQRDDRAEALDETRGHNRGLSHGRAESGTTQTRAARCYRIWSWLGFGCPPA